MECGILCCILEKLLNLILIYEVVFSQNLRIWDLWYDNSTCVQACEFIHSSHGAAAVPSVAVNCLNKFWLQQVSLLWVVTDTSLSGRHVIHGVLLSTARIVYLGWLDSLLWLLQFIFYHLQERNHRIYSSHLLVISGYCLFVHYRHLCSSTYF